MYGLIVSPASTAFLAKRPAANITPGLDVFVHDVIAAITTEPWVSLYCYPDIPQLLQKA